MEQVSNTNNNKVSSELSKEVSRELMNQVNNIVRENFKSRVRLTSSDIYYPEYTNEDVLHYKISIELHYSDTKLEDNYLTLSWFNKRQQIMKFNYSQSSIQRLLQQLEYLNILLHKDSN